jgi:serine/threonine protein kinase
MQRLHMAKPPIIHGDLKCGNVLFEDDGRRCVIADFGLAHCLRSAADGSRSGVGGDKGVAGGLTTTISAPEVLADPRAPRMPPSDVYSFGILLLELLTGAPAYKGMRSTEVARYVLSGLRPAIPEDRVRPEVASLIAACWAQQQSARPTFESIVASLQAQVSSLRHTEAMTDTAIAVTSSTW